MSAISNFFFQFVTSNKKKKQIAAENLKNEIINYLEKLPKESVVDDQLKVLSYLKNNPIGVFPNPFIENYSQNDIEVNSDNSNGLKYVLLDGKRLYFKRKSSVRGVKRNFNNLLIEQDINSPHRYLTSNFNINPGNIIVDIGAAEGNFTLSIIEKVKKAYLFETDLRWIEALEATFAPWKNKVEIIHKNVSDVDDDKNVSIDNFFNSIPEINFIKIDAEGTENMVIKGGEKILAGQYDLKVALCTYHKQDDEINFTRILKNMGFKLESSKGYMIFLLDKEQKPPYLRKGLIRAWKKQ